MTVHKRDVHRRCTRNVLRVHVSTVPEQQTHNVRVAVPAGQVQGRVIESAFYVDVGSSLNEQTNNFGVAVHARAMEGREAFTTGASISTVVQQQTYHGHVAMVTC